MNYLIFSFFFLLTALNTVQAQFVNITPEQAAVKIKKKRIVVLDVRTKEEFAQGHLPRAVNMDVQDSVNFMQQIQSLRKNKTYVVYCRSGKRSVKASEILLNNQFKHIYNMEGGILAWKGELLKQNEQQ
jgi:rhodanese-related sulfurtransferase